MLTPLDVLREPPFKTVVEHMQVTVTTVERLRPLLEALSSDDRAAVERLCQEIGDLEEAADQIKNLARDHLPSTIRLPVSRRDLLTVISAQDKISDNALRIVWLLQVRDFAVPEQIAEPLTRLGDMVIEAVRECLALCNRVEVLAEARFSGPHLDEANKIIARIDSLEAECDGQARMVAKALFAAEHDIGAVNTILWYLLIEHIGSLADAAKKLANRVRLLLAR
ncbi:MAG: TIGR00153 family protein [Armatimonadota bacterium]